MQANIELAVLVNAEFVKLILLMRKHDRNRGELVIISQVPNTHRVEGEIKFIEVDKENPVFRVHKFHLTLQLRRPRSALVSVLALPFVISPRVSAL